LFHLVFESHDGRALVPIPKRSTSPRATSTPQGWIVWKRLTPNGRLEKRTRYAHREFFWVWPWTDISGIEISQCSKPLTWCCRSAMLPIWA